MRQLFSLVFLILLPLVSKGQFEPSYRQITVADGLPTNTIYDIIQGPSGEIVIGHQYGLSRFNGLDIIEMPAREQPPALSNLVMIGTSRYLCRSFNDEIYLVSGNKLHAIDSLSNKRVGYSTFFRYACHMYRSKANRISIVCDGMKPQDVTIFQLPEDAKFHSVTEKNGHVYAIGRDSLYEINLNTAQLVKKMAIGSEIHQFTYAHGDSILLFKPQENRLHYVTNSGLSEPFKFPGYNTNHKVNFIREIGDGITAIGTFGGLYLYDRSFQLIGNFYTHMQISCMTIDREKNLWLGTLQDGILIIPSTEIRSVQSNNLFGETTTISKLYTLNDSLIALGSFNGKLTIVDEKGFIQKKLDFNRMDEVQSIFYNPEKNELLLFCKQLLVMDYNSGQIKNEILIPPAKTIFVSGDTTYCGTSTGLYMLVNNQIVLNSDKELWIKNILPYKNGLILETPSGIHYFDRTELKTVELNEFKEINDLPKPANFISSNDTIYFTSNASVHYLYREKVELLLHTNSNKLRSLTSANGIIYAADNKNIYLIDGTVIDQTKGLELNEIKGLSNLKSTLLVYNAERIQAFNDFIGKNENPPRLFIKEITGSFDRKLISDFSDNLLQISFEILPNISALGNSKLAYDLSGEINASDTITVSEHEQISFERLPYGEYILTLTAINEDGATSKPKKFNITVNRPYYATWWFRLSILSLAVLITLFIMRLRIKMLQRKNIEKLEKERLKTHALMAELKAIRSQMDPHFIFNCLSSIQSSILNNESEQAYENLTVFTKLLREALLFTSREFISLEEEAGFIEKYVHLEQMRSSAPFDFELKVDPELALENEKIPSLITQPFVENAIRHGLMHKESDKKLEFILSKVESGFEVMIKDNGVGIERSKSINAEIRKDHQSTGVKAIHDRIELLNKRGQLIKLKTKTSHEGTEVVFTFYYKK